MLTPAQRHYQSVMAQRHNTEAVHSTAARTAHEEVLHRMRADLASLKRIQSNQAKAEMKRQLLPNYAGWIDGTLESNSGRPDEVIARLMLWAIDAADYAQALRIGRYVVGHGLAMPDRFNRTAPTVLAEEIADAVLNLAASDPDADLSGFTGYLAELEEIIAGQDMPDIVRAKVCKAHAFALRRGDNEALGAALNLLRQAMELNPAAGVKKEIQQLSARLKKTTANPAEPEITGEATTAAAPAEVTVLATAEKRPGRPRGSRTRAASKTGKNSSKAKAVKKN